MYKTYLMLIIVMLFWGFNVSAIKVLVENTDPILLTALRILIAGIAVIVYTCLIKIFRIPTKKELLTITVISLLNTVGHHTFVALGLNETSAINGGIILGLGPIMTLLLAVILDRRKITALAYIGFFIGFSGVVITVLSGQEGFSGITAVSIGDVWIFIGVLTQAYSFILIGRIKPGLDSRLMTGYLLMVGAVMIFIIGLLSGISINELQPLFYHPHLLFILLFSSLISTATGHMIYNSAIQKAGPAETSIFINFNTFFAVLGGFLFLGETITVYHYLGLIFIVTGVLLGSGTVRVGKGE